MFTVSCLITKNCLETVLEAQQHSHSLTKGQEGKKKQPPRTTKTSQNLHHQFKQWAWDREGWGGHELRGELWIQGWAVPQTQNHYLTKQTCSCVSHIHSQTVITVSKQAWTVSGGSLDMSLVPITVLFHKMGSFIYFGLFTRFQVSTS